MEYVDERNWITLRSHIGDPLDDAIKMQTGRASDGMFWRAWTEDVALIILNILF